MTALKVLLMYLWERKKLRIVLFIEYISFWYHPFNIKSVAHSKIDLIL